MPRTLFEATKIYDRLSILLSERGLAHDVFHSEHGGWLIQYILEGKRYTIRPDSLVSEQAWMDEKVTN